MSFKRNHHFFFFHCCPSLLSHSLSVSSKARAAWWSGTAIESAFFFLFFFCTINEVTHFLWGGNWVTEFSAIQHSPLHTRRASVSGEPRKPIRISTCNKMHLRCSLYPFDGSLGFEFRFASRFCGSSWKVSLKRLWVAIGGASSVLRQFLNVWIHVSWNKIFGYLFLFDNGTRIGGYIKKYFAFS